jgi:hypothetical protein
MRIQGLRHCGVALITRGLIEVYMVLEIKENNVKGWDGACQVVSWVPFPEPQIKKKTPNNSVV